MRTIGWILIVIAAYHIATRGVGSADVQIQQGDLLVTDRPLVAGQALVLAAAALYQTFRRRGVSAVVFFVVVLVCQHRSVWAATAVAVVLAFMVSRSKIRSRIVPLIVGLPLIFFVADALGVLGGLPAKLAYSLSSTGTINDRQDAWRTLVDQQNAMGSYSMLFGQPYGTGWERLNSAGDIVTYAPHNWYVQLYLRLGLIALAAVITIFVISLYSSTRSRDALGVAWLALIIVYAVPYHLSWYLAPVFAVALVPRRGDLADSDQEGPPASDTNTGPVDWRRTGW